MASTRASRSTIFRLMNATQHGACPCHGHRGSGHHHHHLNPLSQLRKLATPINDLPEKEYAFEIAASNLRFGEGVTAEVAMDLANMNARKVAVFTDKNLIKLHPMKTVIHALETQGDIPYEIYDDVSVEPTEASWRHAIEWGRKGDFSHFLAVGGGSVIDTAKAANLFTVYKDADLMDFINAPIGKGLAVTKTLRPLIAVPTTAGTGSETTGAAIVDITSKNFKTGIASRALRPTLGIVDTLNTDSCPTQVHISSGLDVLFHALESYTAIPYYERMPRPKNPNQRPAYQGSNDVSDIFSMWALQQAIKYLPRIAKNQDDKEAKKHMLLAATFAGIGVALTGPSVFRFTAPSSPHRHREALALFKYTTPSDPSISRLPDDSIGSALFDAIAKFLDGLGLPRGLTAVGYTKNDLERLVDGTIPQRRVLDLAPGIGNVVGEDGREHLRSILEGAMSY
ncbi:hypothetical protein Clacol_001359 [Clathrus columnatus]|uniref:Alcohol dehydrogenase iron-type/glycerol dehydrogenase GldA domain-containing protein n=1 Tax=Clathrus columnatus TaxID=1419009 RepID=A0AAV5A1I4_9AGAM|nr:hypothetical protein Clacol_001359 [Clathrus columnatus]